MTGSRYLDKTHVDYLADTKANFAHFGLVEPELIQAFSTAAAAAECVARASWNAIYIDGNHDYEFAKADMENCFHLAHKDSIVIIDDTMYTHGWEEGSTRGPTRTWTEHLQQNKIIELGKKDYCYGRGMSWGKYVLE
jgi:predicted O-methyltransferase YrrM